MNKGEISVLGQKVGREAWVGGSGLYLVAESEIVSKDGRRC